MEEIHLKKEQKKKKECVLYANLYKLPLERGYLWMLCRININCAMNTTNGNEKSCKGILQYVRGILDLSAVVVETIKLYSRGKIVTQR